jgi:hypothetical protein
MVRHCQIAIIKSLTEHSSLNDYVELMIFESLKDPIVRLSLS